MSWYIGEDQGKPIVVGTPNPVESFSTELLRTADPAVLLVTGDYLTIHCANAVVGYRIDVRGTDWVTGTLVTYLPID